MLMQVILNYTNSDVYGSDDNDDDNEDDTN